jgi:hypothetical protein
MKNRPNNDARREDIDDDDRAEEEKYALIFRHWSFVTGHFVICQ